jgi:hypothetical protein
MRKILILASLCVAGLLMLAVMGIVALAWLDPLGADADWKAQKEKKKILIETHATKDEVIRLLGKCTDYSRGTTNEIYLKQFLGRESDRWNTLRQNVARCPGVLHTSTINVQTWIFLNESNRVVDIILTSQ